MPAPQARFGTTHKVDITLPEEFWEWVDRNATDQRRSRANYVSLILHKVIEDGWV